jgi:hypothetical protein
MSESTPPSNWNEGVVSKNAEGKRVWMPKALYYSNSNKELCSKLDKARRTSSGYLLLPTNQEIITVDRMSENSKDIFMGQVNVGYIYKHTMEHAPNGKTSHFTTKYEVSLHCRSTLTGQYGEFTIPTLRKDFHCNQTMRSPWWNTEYNPEGAYSTARDAMKMAVEWAKAQLASLIPTEPSRLISSGIRGYDLIEEDCTPEPSQDETVSKGILEGWTKQKGEDVTLITSPDQLVRLQWHSMAGYEDYFILKVWSEEEEKYVIHSRPDAWRAAHREALSLYTPSSEEIIEPEAQFAAWASLSHRGQMLEIPKCVTDIGFKTEYTTEEQSLLDEWNAYKKQHVKPAPLRVIRRMLEEKQLAKIHDVRRAFDAYSMALNGTERMGPANSSVQQTLRDEWLKEQARSEAILECLSIIYQNDQ